MLKHALKEWAVICYALAAGRQALILRKGGIEESNGGFRLEHTRFWLFPTYVHQQSTGIKESAIPLLKEVEQTRPPAGVIRLSHFAEAAGVFYLHDMVGALRLDHLHVWSQETVHARFAYRSPGLQAIPLRVYRAAEPAELPDTAKYTGCRSWVELDRTLPTAGATPVMDDQAFRELLKELDRLLNPTALA
jgi:hypothetical protein